MTQADDFVVVYDTYGDGSDYTTLYSYHGIDENVVIPEHVDAIAEGAFRGDMHVRTVDLSNVTDVDKEAFMGCSALESVVIRGGTTIDIRAFKGCCALKCVKFKPNEPSGDSRSAELDVWFEAFADCTSLERVDLHLAVGDLTLRSRAFAGCTTLTTVVLSGALSHIESDTFEGCTALECVSLPEIPLDSTTEELRAYETALGKLRGSCLNLRILEQRPGMGPIDAQCGDGEDPSSGTSHAYRSNVRRFAYRDYADLWAGRPAKSLFRHFKQLEELDLAGIDTSGEESLACMFKGCTELREVDLSPLDTSSARDMRQMFFGCRNLKTIDLSVLDTSQVEDMSHLFHNCYALKRVNLAGLDLSRVRSLWSAFDRCEYLEELDFSQVRTPALEKVGYMFRGCWGLRSLDLRGLDLSHVKEDISHLFFHIDYLEYWRVSETWPINRPGAIPENPLHDDEWWSERDRRWMTMAQIRARGPVADTYYNSYDEDM